MPNNTGLLRPANIVQPSSAVATILLSTTPQQIDNIPFGQVVAFGATANFGVSYGTTVATFPAASTTSASTAAGATEINPTVRNLQSTSVTSGITVIGTTAGGFLTAAFYTRGG